MGEKIKSQSSNEEAFLRFWNISKRCVNILWVDFEGNSVHYKELQPNQYIEINTYVTHPWTFEDSHSGDKLIGNNAYVFVPESWSAVVKRLPKEANMTPQRVLVRITVPVYSLRERCLQVVRDCIDTPRLAYRLQIPISLQDDLFDLLEKRCKLRQ